MSFAQVWNEEIYKKYLAEGRGQGEGINYIPWLQVYKFRTKTGRTREPGWTTGRPHHLFSFLEQKLFLILDWSDIVIDIQEQYPMFDYELAQEIAKELNWEYPVNRKSKFPYILTTDFLVYYKENGEVKKIALAVKHSSALKECDKSKESDEKDVLARLELEYRYWNLKKIEWKLVTEKHVPDILIYNLKLILGDLRLEATKKDSVEKLQSIIPEVKEYFARFQGSEKPIHSITDQLDSRLNLKDGTAFRVFKHLVASREITVDLNTVQLDESPTMELVKQVIFN